MRALIRWTWAVPVSGSWCRAAWSHGVDAPPRDAPSWTFDPLIVVPLLLAAALFAVGWGRLRARARDPGGNLRRRGRLFAAGWGVVAAALVSPLHAAGERSFSAHMLEHEVLMLLGAPILVLAAPLVIFLWSMPASLRAVLGRIGRSRGLVASVWSRATSPVIATAVQAAALWLWHAPVLFDLALGDRGWHALQHVSFLGSALLFWTAMLRRSPATHRGTASLCLFATSLISGALGALMAFSQSPWYQGYARWSMAPFGLSAAEDQQIAGLLMWIPGGLVHALVALMLVRSLLVQAAPSRRGSDAT